MSYKHIFNQYKKSKSILSQVLIWARGESDHQRNYIGRLHFYKRDIIYLIYTLRNELNLKK